MTGKGVTSLDNSFKQYGLHDTILQGIEDMGIIHPSKIQSAAITSLMQRDDVVGRAQTGTGKTLAFGAVLLDRYVKNSQSGLKALVLAPTRELAIQIQEELMRIGKYTKIQCLAVYGGSHIQPQIKAIKKGVDIIIGTPGRVMDLMEKRVLKLHQIDCVVIDEADEMLNMGFVEDIETILSQANARRQTLLFSATMPEGILKISKHYMKADAKRIFIEEKSMTASTIRQAYFHIKEYERYEALCRILDTYAIERAMIFCKTKKDVDELASQMIQSGYLVGYMHGDLSQEARLETLRRFKNHQIKYLVATDVASRGIDVKDVSHVINYTLPQDTESYVHRIGRCGRANSKGEALSLATSKEIYFLKEIEKQQKTTIKQRQLPSFKQILSSKQEEVMEEINDVISSGLHKTYLQDLARLSKQDLIQVASSLFYLQATSHMGYHYTQENLGVIPAVGAVFLELGPNYATSVKEVTSHLEKYAKLKHVDIGKVTLERGGVRVELTSKKAMDMALKYLQDTKLGKRRINIYQLEK